MPRLIDADAMRQDWLENGENEHVYDTNDFLDSIDDQPTIDVEPVKHGRWMIHHYNGKTYEFEDIPYNPLSFDNPSGTLFCSVCDSDALLNAHEEDVPSRFCPNCGAKMDAKEE